MDNLELNKIYLGDCLDFLDKIPKPDLILCDPPYQFQASGKGIMSKQKVMESIKEINTNSFNAHKFIPKLLKTQGNDINAYFFCNKELLPDYLNIARRFKCSFDILFLVKNNPLPCKNKHYVVDTEYIVFMRKKNAYFNNDYPFNFYKKHYFINIGNMDLSHPNQKPIKLIEKLIKISSKENDLVIDFFNGSGTTTLAAQLLNRKFLGFEINQKYVDIANKRLEQTNLYNFNKTTL